MPTPNSLDIDAQNAAEVTPPLPARLQSGNKPCWIIGTAEYRLDIYIAYCYANTEQPRHRRV